MDSERDKAARQWQAAAPAKARRVRGPANAAKAGEEHAVPHADEGYELDAGERISSFCIGLDDGGNFFPDDDQRGPAEAAPLRSG